MKDWVDIARNERGPQGFRLGRGLEQDRNGVVEFVPSPSGPLYHDGRGWTVRVGNGSEIATGSPPRITSSELVRTNEMLIREVAKLKTKADVLDATKADADTATDSVDGLMSKEDKAKLDALPQPAIADADAGTVVAKVNAILSALRAAGILEE